MEMTLLAKILWFFWVLISFDLLIDWVAKIPNTKVRSYLDATFGLVTIITAFALALLPFVNLLWK